VITHAAAMDSTNRRRTSLRFSLLWMLSNASSAV